MSVGIVFCTANHCCEVERDTGRIRVSCSDTTTVTAMALSTLENIWLIQKERWKMRMNSKLLEKKQ